MRPAPRWLFGSRHGASRSGSPNGRPNRFNRRIADGRDASMLGAVAFFGRPLSGADSTASGGGFGDAGDTVAFFVVVDW